MSRFFIDRPIVAIVISILTVLFGGIVIRGLSVEQYPFLAPPNIRVTATYPGAAAEADVGGHPAGRRPQVSEPVARGRRGLGPDP